MPSNLSPTPATTPTQPTGAPSEFYTWQGYRCAYEVQLAAPTNPQQTPLLLIHPIGVGLSRRFWDRFSQVWFNTGQSAPLYNPDLLGCGESDQPRVAYQPEDWAAQLHHFIQTVIQRPVIVVTQGALFPVAIALTQDPEASPLVKGLILAGPPAWAVMTQAAPAWQQKVLWNLFDSPVGAGFYRYARRRDFLRSFSAKQLFDKPEDVDQQWLTMLKAGAEDMASRHAVFSFLAGFWRRNYATAIAQIQQPTLVVLGETASSISRSGKSESPEQRMADYLEHLPRGEGVTITGRNVLPYECSETFVETIAPFVARLG